MIDPSPPYHHGDLANALLEAGRALLASDGLEALSLRAVTRRAGVSATAAVPHFGNLAGLRAALAAEGYRELALALGEASSAHQAGMAYIRFALANPNLFQLMFRRALLSERSEALQSASQSAFEALRGLAQGLDTATGRDEGSAARMAGLWGRVHGLAMLAIDGMLSPMIAAEGFQTVEGFLAKALDSGGRNSAD